MTFPITPPPFLVEQWFMEQRGLSEASRQHIATAAARWGADQELDACCEQVAEWQEHWECKDERLRDARRSKPPSLKERALAAFARLKSGALCADRVTDESTVRRALEALHND